MEESENKSENLIGEHSAVAGEVHVNEERVNLATSVPLDNPPKKNENNQKDVIVEDKSSDNSSVINDILDHVQNCPAVFKNQQIGDPELTTEDKRIVAEKLLKSNPSNFLTRFGSYLREDHLEYFSSIKSPEVIEYARQIMMCSRSDRRLQQKNRRYEALKRLEAEGVYFSEVEMEKRDPLLYHQLVGQFLTEDEKLKKNRQSNSGTIPTFLNFLINKMERDEVTALRKSQQEAENNIYDEMSDSEDSCDSIPSTPRWGDDWVDAENAVKKKKKTKKQKKKKKVWLSTEEKALLVEEFKSLMHSKFLNGLEPEFNYDDVDFNPDYDSLQTKSQDAEDKYFDEESCDAEVCTDTGIEDY